MTSRWKTDRRSVTGYDFVVQNRVLSRIGARLLWNYDIRHLRQAIAAQDPAALTLDIPCGGGVAVRDNPRHVAADVSRTMLGRARRKTSALVQADIYALPFPSGLFDACVTYNGLHCLPTRPPRSANWPASSAPAGRSAAPPSSATPAAAPTPSTPSCAAGASSARPAPPPTSAPG